MKTYTILSAIQLFVYNLLFALNRTNNYVISQVVGLNLKPGFLYTVGVVMFGSVLLTSCKKDDVELNNAPAQAKIENAPATAEMESAPPDSTQITSSNDVLAVTGSALNKLNLVPAPYKSGILYGNINGTGAYNFMPVARDLNGIYHQVVFNRNARTQIGPISFVRGGVLPNTQKPFYYLKAGSQYLIVTLVGVITSATPNGTFAQFVFTKAPNVAGAPGPTYNIHCVGLSGKNAYVSTLQIWFDTSIHEYGIGSRTTNQTSNVLKLQVFAIKSTPN